jgi:hypothetical protein
MSQLNNYHIVNMSEVQLLAIKIEFSQLEFQMEKYIFGIFKLGIIQFVLMPINLG